MKLVLAIRREAYFRPAIAGRRSGAGAALVSGSNTDVAEQFEIDIALVCFNVGMGQCGGIGKNEHGGIALFSRDGG